MHPSPIAGCLSQGVRQERFASPVGHCFRHKRWEYFVGTSVLSPWSHSIWAADPGEEWTAVHPFDLKTVFLAKHAQHVVLIHFPIALFIASVAFDLAAQWTKRRGLAEAAYYNLVLAAISTVPVIATGILAWQFALEGQKLKGILLLHMVLASASTVMIWLV